MKYILEYTQLYELGQRSNQEDSLYPVAEGLTENSLYIVCDGMGGHDSGEVASSIVCQAMSRYVMEHHKTDEPFTDEIFNAALSYAYDCLDQNDNGAEKKMGTTMTFVYFHSAGCYAAHIGDSRIYHIRPSASRNQRIQYVSRDHSLVNDLLAVGELMPDEVADFKYKNIITRSMQPNQERRPKAEIKRIDDIRSGDYFLLCSDGVIENLGDMDLADIISEKKVSDMDKIARLRQLTADNKDNHTANLICVKRVKGRKYSHLWWKSVMWMLLSFILTFAAGIMLMRYRHYEQIEQFISDDIERYNEIFHMIDSLEQNSTEQSKLVDIYWLCREAALIEEKHKNKLPDFSEVFSHRATEVSDSIKSLLDTRRDVIRQLISDKQQEIDAAMKELSAIESLD